MNPRADHDRLLEEVLAEAEPTPFRSALLEETLRDVQRRKNLRRTARVAFATAAMIVLMLWLWRAPAAAQVERCPVVHTRPLPASAIVSTRLSDPVQRVASQPFLASFHTLEGTAPVRLITDVELLALAGPRPAVLVRIGPEEQALIFADEAPGRR